jgi:beta-N-acetylhexosaminidase
VNYRLHEHFALPGDDQYPIVNWITRMLKLPKLLFKFMRCHALKVLLFLMLLSLCVVVANALFKQQRRQAVLTLAVDQARVLGGRFIVGYDDPAQVMALAKRGLIAGVFVARHNVKGKSLMAIQQEISSLQTTRKAAGLPALIIATDQEGGPVSRLSPPLVWQPALSTLLLADLGKTSFVDQAFNYGVEQGRALARLGVNVNFSPVVDIKSERAASTFDFFSQINTRAISDKPKVVANMASAYSQGLASVGVVATLKHFPGLGEVATDTHLFPAKLDTPLQTLQQRDWLPFRHVLGQTDALVMLAHVTVPGLDAHYPASLSHKVVQGVIRQSWQHEGVLITDDLTMRAAQRHSNCGATLAALNAGVDLLLLSYEHDRYDEAMLCAARALTAGKLDAALLASSAQRLAKLYQRLMSMSATTASPAPRLAPH